MNVGPDAYRYLQAAAGTPLPRPFSLRFALPMACGTSLRLWWIQHIVSWVVMCAAFVTWRLVEGDGWQYAVAAAVTFLALPGLAGPAIRPIGVDHASTALGLVAVLLAATDHPMAWPMAVVVTGFAAAVKESTPVWVALWAWSPIPLLALVVSAVRWWQTRGVQPPDPIPQLQHVTDHPLRAALAARRRTGRDAWVWVAPWGLTLLALYQPSWPVVAALVVAHLQLIVATDHVRLVQFAAGPVVAVAAVQVVPVQWLALVVVAHVVWWRKPEVV